MGREAVNEERRGAIGTLDAALKHGDVESQLVAVELRRFELSLPGLVGVSLMSAFSHKTDMLGVGIDVRYVP